MDRQSHLLQFLFHPSIAFFISFLLSHALPGGKACASEEWKAKPINKKLKSPTKA
jgi:hypothetical protein